MRFGLSLNTSLRCLVLGEQSTLQYHLLHLGTMVGAVGVISTPGTTVHSARAGDSPATRGGIGIGICAMATPTTTVGQAHSDGGAGEVCTAPHTTTGDGTILTITTIGEATGEEAIGVTHTTAGAAVGALHLLVTTLLV